MEFESNKKASQYKTLKKSINHEKEMKIYVLQPFLHIIQIKLNANIPISTLNNLFPYESLFLYNGQILDSQKNFIEYKISDNGKIVMIPSFLLKSNPSFIEKWLKETKNRENFEFKINIRINKRNNNELARLKDLKLFKKEMRQKNMKKFNKKEKVLKYYLNFLNDAKDKLKTDYVSLNSPSCSPLPILW